MNLLIHVDNSESVVLMALVALAAAVLIADAVLGIFLAHMHKCPRKQTKPAEAQQEETGIFQEPQEEAEPAEELALAEEMTPAEEPEEGIAFAEERVEEGIAEEERAE